MAHGIEAPERRAAALRLFFIIGGTGAGYGNYSWYSENLALGFTQAGEDLAADAQEGRRNLWLRTLDRLGLGERIRDVDEAPDGAIWLLTDSGCRITSQSTPSPRSRRRCWSPSSGCPG